MWDELQLAKESFQSNVNRQIWIVLLGYLSKRFRKRCYYFGMNKNYQIFQAVIRNAVDIA